MRSCILIRCQFRTQSTKYLMSCLPFHRCNNYFFLLLTFMKEFYIVFLFFFFCGGGGGGSFSFSSTAWKTQLLRLLSSKQIYQRPRLFQRLQTTNQVHSSSSNKVSNEVVWEPWRHLPEWRTENTLLGSRMQWFIDAWGVLVYSETLSPYRKFD